LVCALVVASAPVAAQPTTPNPEADAALAEGRKLYDLQEWDKAIMRFKEAYRLRPDAPALFNIAQSYRLKGDCKEAATFYKTYKRNYPTASNIDKVDKFIVETEECAKTQPVKPVTTEPIPPTTTTTTPVTPPVTPPEDEEPETPAPEPGSNKAWMKWTAIGAGVVGLISIGLGTKFALDGSSKSDELRDKCATSCTSEEALAIESDGNSANTKAKIFFAVGGVATAAGVVLFVLSRQGGGGDEEPAVSIKPTRGGATAAYAWRF
jgi:tetratricopeptide (TPR) repeat protein